jgi:hypothetical protein
MVTKNNCASVILVHIPCRYDTAKTNTVNEGNEKFNMNLEKLIKASHACFLKTHQNKKLFTKHGLQHNRLRKQLLFHQFASMVCSLFEQNTTCPISLGWNKPEDSISQDKSLNRLTTCNRKLPVTTSKDF